jgi:hypothetical protein
MATQLFSFLNASFRAAGFVRLIRMGSGRTKRTKANPANESDLRVQPAMSQWFTSHRHSGGLANEIRRRTQNHCVGERIRSCHLAPKAG